MCGACCNRSPEVELSEAAALVDVFVFRLMFRLYSLPRAFRRDRTDSSETFYEKKRLLAGHAARQFPRKIIVGGKRVEIVQYLMISALAVDTADGACAALVQGRCSIHERRPVGCRTVPLHYSRPGSLAVSDLDAFLQMPGHRCDASEDAALFVQNGQIVDWETLRTREQATELAERDRPWKEAIVRAMKTGGGSGAGSLPSLAEVEANAAFAAMTTSMRAGWQIATEAGLISRNDYRRLVDAQLATIERELARARSSAAERETLEDMRAEYRQVLGVAA